MQKKQIASFFLILIIALPAFADKQASPNYIIKKDVFCQSSGVISSTNYQHMFTLAQPSAIGKSSGTTYDNFGGFWFPESTRYLLSLFQGSMIDGQVKINGVLNNFPYVHAFDENAVLELEAVSDKNQFAYWTGDLIDTENPYHLTMNENISITATFVLIPYQLSLHGSGKARVNGTLVDLPWDDTFPMGTSLNIEFIGDNNTVTSQASYVINEDKSVFQMNLVAGWNLLSLPVTPVDNTMTAIFPDAEIVYKFEKGSYRIVTDMHAGSGYWVKNKYEKSYPIDGQSFENYNQVLNKGWHLIGAVNVAHPPKPEGNINAIYRYTNGSYVLVDKCEPGFCYWVKLSAECIFSVGE